jgi:Dolichyl-phosphate-mannose-protein mannosyltransferase/C-terminal four TMM region of protein-O-mannosyltransferase
MRKERQLLLLLGLATRLLFIGHPSSVVFDEVHYANFISKYWRNQYVSDVHPPLGKLVFYLIFLIPRAFGEKREPKELYRIGDTYLDGPFSVAYLLLRSLSALSSVLLLIVTDEILVSSGLSHWDAFKGSLVFLFEPSFHSIHRLFMVDSLTHLSSALVLLCIMKMGAKKGGIDGRGKSIREGDGLDRASEREEYRRIDVSCGKRESVRKPESRRSRVFGSLPGRKTRLSAVLGVVFGVGLSIKWTLLFLVPSILLCFAIDFLIRTVEKPRSVFRPVYRVLLLFSVSTLVYALSFSINFFVEGVRDSPMSLSYRAEREFPEGFREGGLEMESGLVVHLLFETGYFVGTHSLVKEMGKDTSWVLEREGACYRLHSLNGCRVLAVTERSVVRGVEIGNCKREEEGSIEGDRDPSLWEIRESGNRFTVGMGGRCINESLVLGEAGVNMNILSEGKRASLPVDSACGKRSVPEKNLFHCTPRKVVPFGKSVPGNDKRSSSPFFESIPWRMSSCSLPEMKAVSILRTSRLEKKGVLGKMLEVNRKMLEINKSLKGSHPYASRPLDWLFPAKHLLMWSSEISEYLPSQHWKDSSFVILFVNHVSLSLATLSLPLLFLRAFSLDFFSLGWEKILLSAYVSSYLPFFFISRETYLHHYLSPLYPLLLSLILSVPPSVLSLLLLFSFTFFSITLPLSTGSAPFYEQCTLLALLGNRNLPCDSMRSLLDCVPA